MMKTTIIIFLYNIISISFINATALDQRCYICDGACTHPTASNIKSCDENSDTGSSGKPFVAGALGDNNATNVYKTLKNSLIDYNTNQLSLNTSTAPSWDHLTRWVCYVTKDKHRGCLIMGKGLCAEDKGWLATISDVGSKLSSIIQRAKNAVGTMFKDTGVSQSLSDTQKQNVTNWMVENYMNKLVKNDKGDAFQLESCCEGSECNFASIIQKPTGMLFLIFLLISILV